MTVGETGTADISLPLFLSFSSAQCVVLSKFLQSFFVNLADKNTRLLSRQGSKQKASLYLQSSNRVSTRFKFEANHFCLNFFKQKQNLIEFYLIFSFQVRQILLLQKHGVKTWR